MLIKKNPWGVTGGADSQRADLWLVDFNQVYQFLVNDEDMSDYVKIPVFNKYYSRISSLGSENLSIYPSSVSFPTESMKLSETVKGTVPINFPGEDNPLGEIKMEFLHEVTRNSYDMSVIYSFIRLWWLTGRIGRSPNSSDSEFIPWINPQSAFPAFRQDVTVYLLTNWYNESSEKEYQDYYPRQTLNVINSYTLKRCWVSDIQLGTLSYDRAEPLKFTASLSAMAIIPDVKNNLLWAGDAGLGSVKS